VGSRFAWHTEKVLRLRSMVQVTYSSSFLVSSKPILRCFCSSHWLVLMFLNIIWHLNVHSSSPTFTWNRRHGTNSILKSSFKPFLWIYSQLLVVPTWSTGGLTWENHLRDSGAIYWDDFYSILYIGGANLTCISSIYNQTTEVKTTIHALLKAYLVRNRCTILLCPVIISLL
jgi:hypothetical protein